MRITYLSPLLLAAVGLIIFFYAKRSQPNAMILKDWSRTGAMVFGLLFASITAMLAFMVFFSEVKRYNNTKEIYYEKKYLITSGRVENCDPMPKWDRKPEAFDVNGVHFEFMDFDLTNYGYNNAATHGGAIKPNLFVRIGYYNNGEKNVILRLETE
jgi:hypothetical protein